MKKAKKMSLPAWGAAVLLCLALVAGWGAASVTSYAEGEGESHDHSVGWTQLSVSGGAIGEGSSADTPARYYLAADTILTENLRLAENASVALCLNGFLLATECVDSVITVPTGAELTVCDCRAENAAEEHLHAYYKDEYGKYVFDYGQEGWQAEYDAAAEKGALAGGVLTGGDARNVNGGAIRIDGGTLFLTGGAIAGNEASDPRNGSGGGIYMKGGAIYLSGGTIQGNAAGRGGGIFMEGGVFSMTGGDISYNMAVKTASSTLESKTGGGIYAKGDYTFTMTDGEIACNGAGYEGGGLYLRDSAVVLEGSAIRGNSAYRGGGLAVGAYADITLKTALTENTAESAGGGVCVTYGKFTLEEGGSITGNSAYSGGGMYVTCIAAIRGGALSDNTAESNGGGVCVTTNDASVTVYGGEISRNRAENGGGVYAKGTLFMYGGKICANAAETLAGGVAIEENTAKFIQLNMTGGEISGNGEEGYDVYFFGGRKEIRGGYIGTIGEESATEIGGVYYAYFSEEPASSFIGWQSGCILLEDGSLDADFNAAFPYAVYIIRDVELTAKYSDPVYDGSPIEPQKDFEVSAPADVELVYEYAVSGESEYTAGLPVNAGDYVIRVDLGEPFLKTTEDGKEYYPSGVRTLELTIDKKIPSFTSPFGLSAEYGKPLSEVVLPYGWVWQDDTIVVDTLENFEAVAIFVPEDPDNYQTLVWTLTLSVYEEAEGGEEPTDPPEGGGETTDPPEGGEEPTDPPEGGGETTDPPEGGGEPTNPPEGGGETTNPPESAEEPKGLTGGAIAGIVVGSIAGAAALAYAVCAILFKKGIIKGAFFAKIYPFFRP